MASLTAHTPPRSTAATLAGVAALGFVAGLAAYQGKKMAVQAVSSAKGDWVDALVAEHRMVEAVFRRLLRTSEKQTVQRAGLLTAIAHLLGKHALEEENVIYPALRGGAHDKQAQEFFLDHADIKTYIHELEELPKSDPLWIQKAQNFFNLIRKHVAEEERLFPTFRSSLSDRTNRRLGLQIYREGVKLA